jgi:hypothetical protein
MNWDAIGAIAELVGATGVIASLFYLGTQIQQNTRSVRASSYHALLTNLSNLSAAIGRDSSTADVFVRGQSDFHGLSTTERAQFAILLVSLFRNYENIFYQSRKIMLEDSVRLAWEHSMTRYFWQPGVQAWWPAWRDDCHREFREFLEGSVPPKARSIGDVIGVATEPAA